MRSTLLLVGVLGFLACGPQAPSAPTEPEGPSGVAAAQSSTEGATDSCPQVLEGIAGDVVALSLQHAQGCTQDTDCVLVDLSISCLENACQMPVLRDEAASFFADLSAYEAQTCPSAPTTCGMGGSCAALSGAACVAGVCRPVLPTE